MYFTQKKLKEMRVYILPYTMSKKKKTSIAIDRKADLHIDPLSLPYFPLSYRIYIFSLFMNDHDIILILPFHDLYEQTFKIPCVTIYISMHVLDPKIAFHSTFEPLRGADMTN